MPPVRQVVLFVVDGLRPDALQQAHTPAIHGLVARGAHTWRAQTMVPSITLPCFVSMFYTVPPSRHGVTTNVWRPPEPSIASLIEVVHQAGLGTATFYTWEELRDLAPPGALDLLLADHGGQDHDHSTGVAQDLTIPWILSGPAIRPGQAIIGEVHITATAPTLLHLLGLPQPAQWSGRVVTEALVP